MQRSSWGHMSVIMLDLKTEVVIRPFDAARDGLSLRECVIDHQNFHRRIELSWPQGEAIVRDYMSYLDGECAIHNGCIMLAHRDDQVVGFVCVVAAMRGE